MAFLDYSGLSHFLDKLKAMVFGGATSSANGDAGLVPAPSAGDQNKFLKGDGTWDDVDALPVVTSSDNNKVLEVVNGEWTTGSKKINKEYELPTDWTTKTWTEVTPILGGYIWSDGENIYYSYNSNQYVLDKSTSTWVEKTWTGLTNFSGDSIWSDGENVYYSNGSSYVLDKSTSTWSSKTWTGLTKVYANYIWSDGDNIYHSNGYSYILDKSTSTWSSKTWSGLSYIYRNGIWTDGENIYYSSGSNQYALNKSTSTWSTKTWDGLTDFYGNSIWTDGENIYYSNGLTQYVLDKSTSTWTAKTWTGLTNFTGNDIWSDGENIYYSNGSTQYQFNSSTNVEPKILLGTNGEFNSINLSSFADLVKPSDMTGASSSSAGTHGLVPAPAQGDQNKFLKGDGTWGEISASHAAFVENDVDILTTDWVAGTNVYTYTYTNSAILSDTLVDVFYKDGAEDVLQSKVSVSKAVGSIILTVESVPTGTLPITIRLIQNTDSTVVADASTTQAGIVQLSDSVSDTSTTKAATSSAVKSVNDKLGTIPSGQTLQGQIDTVSSNLGTIPSGKTVQGQIDTLKDEAVYYGTCSETAAATAQKAVSCTNFPTTLKAGQKLSVKFTNANTASNPTLKVNSLDAKSIVRYGSTVAKSGDWKAGEVVDFMFDGTNWVMVGGGIHDNVDALNSKLPISYSKGAITAKEFMGIYGFVTTSATYLALYVPMIFNPDVTDITNIVITNAGIRISDGGYVIGNGADLTQYVIGAYVFKLQGLVRIDLEKSGGWGVTNNTICIGNATLSFTLS